MSGLKSLTDAEKAAILDWLLTPVSSGRADRPDRIDRMISRNTAQALMVFRAWSSPDEVIEAIKKEMAK